MKKTILLFACAFSVLTAGAQISLTGTSYTETFDALGGGMPSGWFVYKSATSSSLGSLDALTSPLPGYPSMAIPDTVSCSGLYHTGGFKNFPSADVASPADNWCGAPPTYTDRALGLRQVGSSYPGLDAGASFNVELANTTGISNMNLTFKLQSLDTSSPRVTTWTVDYGLGSAPSSFTTVTPAAGSIMTTGGHTWANNVVTVSLPAAINNQSGPVWIRIGALTASTGSGNRASSAIDDFSLTYNNTAGVSNVNANGNMSLNVMGFATTSAISFNCNADEAGQYTLAICDMAGRSVYTESVNLNAGGQVHAINANLASGIYVARLTNGSAVATAKVVVR